MGVIYQIKNKINNKIYIGQTANFHRRISDHKRQLRNGTHKNVYLRAAWATDGEENFEFSILESDISNENLHDREQFWIDAYRESGLLYNLFLVALRGKKRQNSWRKAIEEKGLLYNINLGVKNPNYGKPRSDETKKKIGEAQMGELNHMYGKTHSSEAKRKIGAASAKNKVKSYPSFTSPEGIIYPPGVSLKDFCLQFGYGIDSNFYKGLNSLINKNRNSYFGWKLT